MKKWVIRILVVVIVAVIAIFGVKEYKTLTTPQKIHYHAGFVLFVNDKKIDFSKARYMSVSPCTLHATEDDSPEAIQHDKAHLHDYVGDVVHVERTGGKWKDLFINISYQINWSKVTAYIMDSKLRIFKIRLSNLLTV